MRSSVTTLLVSLAAAIPRVISIGASGLTDIGQLSGALLLALFGACLLLTVYRFLSADREANLLEALLGPSLRSRNPDRRKEALETLESLAATVSHLKHLLLVRDLRRLAGE